MTESEILTKSNIFQCSKHQHSNPTMFSEILKIKHKSKTRSMSRARYRSLYIVHTSALVFSLGFSIVLTGFQLKISVVLILIDSAFNLWYTYSSGILPYLRRLTKMQVRGNKKWVKEEQCGWVKLGHGGDKENFLSCWSGWAAKTRDASRSTNTLCHCVWNPHTFLSSSNIETLIIWGNWTWMWSNCGWRL